MFLLTGDAAVFHDRSYIVYYRSVVLMPRPRVNTEAVPSISTILAKADINIVEMLNRSKGAYACTIIDASKPMAKKTIKAISDIDGVVKVRALTTRRLD